MTDIKWTKSYEVKIDSRHFKIFVSEQGPGEFHASCLWYEKGRMLKAPNEMGSFSFQLEQRHAAAEQEALNQILSWVKTQFGEAYKLEQSQG